MSKACERIRGRFPEYGREALSPSERRAVRAHLTGCAACRAEAAAADPVLLFSGISPEAVSSEEVASLVASVRAGIALRQAELRIEPSPQKGRRRAARLAAAAAVFVLTLAVPSGMRSPDPAGPSAVAERPAAPLATVAVPERAAATSSGATVYSWNPGAGEPRVVWIVDGSLDL